MDTWDVYFQTILILNDNVCASHVGDVNTRKSITGYIRFMISGDPVSWQSRIQSSVARSTIEAKSMAVSAETQKDMWQARLLEQMGMRIEIPY